MTVLGFQLVVTMIGACVLSKLLSYFSLSRYIYRGLTRYLAPSDTQLLENHGNAKLKSRMKKRRADAGTTWRHSKPIDEDTFYFPRNFSIELTSSRVTYSEVATLPLYSTFQWLLDFSICAFGVYFVTEFTYYFVTPWLYPLSSHETQKVTLSNILSLNTGFNLSLIWLLLSAWFCVTTLISITTIYFRSSPNQTSNLHARSSEWLLVMASAFVHFILSVVLLSMDGKYFDFGLNDASLNLTTSLTTSGDSIYAFSKIVHFILALISALIGALFIYPGMKFGKVYFDAVRKSSLNPFWRVGFHLTFIAPLFPILLWIRPFTDHLSRSLALLSFNSAVVNRPFLHLVLSTASSLFSTHLSTVRLLLSAMVVVFRLGIVRWLLQTYLDSAQDRIDQFSREIGRTSNKEVQRMVASIFYCLNLVALQWLAPTILLLISICLYKNSAGLAWFPVSTSSTVRTACAQFSVAHSVPAQPSDSWLAFLTHARQSFLQSSGQLCLRGVVIAETMTNFISWWLLVSMQTVNLIGLAYHRFVSE